MLPHPLFTHFCLLVFGCAGSSLLHAGFVCLLVFGCAGSSLLHAGFVCLLVFGCTGSSLLHAGFVWLWGAVASLAMDHRL